MKGPAQAPAVAQAGKRRWRCAAAVGAAVALAFFSVVVPLAVLLGLHGRFPSMYLVNKSAVSVYDGSETGSWEQIPSKDWKNTNTSQSEVVIGSQPELGKLNGNISINPAPPIQEAPTFDSPTLPNITNDPKDNFEQGLPGGENGKSCQLQFGSYCRWSVEHKEVMNDSTVKRLKDQLFVARAYYPSIVKLDGIEKLSREMKQSIQEHERMLSEAISDADLPKL